jgi:Transposase and inactivated derivatives
MIIKTNIVTDMAINTLQDLYKLKPFLEDSTLKINKSQIARELNVNRKTVDKYIDGFQKSSTRNKPNSLSSYIDVIEELLSEQYTQMFYYKRILWQYLKDNHQYNGSYNNFVKNLKKYPNLNGYFSKQRPRNTNQINIRYETEMAHQAQIDWKESIDFKLVSGENITINVFVYLLSYSRFRIYRLSMSKTQEVLFSFLDQAFETLGGVPNEILCDNMKTIMDKARTEHKDGKVNVRYQQFANDYGFKVKPCVAGRPQTKAKVEAPMKILDEIRAYSGKLNYLQLHELVEKINNRVNLQVNQGTGRIPAMYFQKERAFLNDIPKDNIRKPYQLTTNMVKVNTSCMFHCQNKQYSVAPEYIGKNITYQVYDNYLHVYFNTKLITVHHLSESKLNYHTEDYEAIARKSHSFKEENIKEYAAQNLKLIGEMYNYEQHL